MTPVILSGPALHSGVPSTVRVVRRPEDGLGIRFSFPGFAGPLDARAVGTLPRSARRATVLEGPGGAVIRTPEHLLAASLFFAGEPLDITCDAAEPPGLDGSARPWFTAIAAAAEKPGRRPEYAAPGWRHEGPEGFLLAESADWFSVEYTIARGVFRETFRLDAAEAAPSEILPARTFMFWEDFRGAHGEGLLAGAGGESGILLAASPGEFAAARAALPESRGNAFPLIHPAAFRMEAEAARHKILDLLGDLALGGLALPKLRLEIRNGGHALNHLLLDHLKAGSRRD
jgi:UDP-3-O-acyl-N-acetylglucosamine deacetylase